jgi:hypothetical protein
MGAKVWIVKFPKEYSRSVEVVADVVTKRLRPSMAGTLMVDRAWRTLKDRLPKGGLSAQTANGRHKFTLHLRAAQWKRMHSTADRWPLFCEEVKRWVAEHEGKTVRIPSSVAVESKFNLPLGTIDAARRRLRKKMPPQPPNNGPSAASVAEPKAPRQSHDDVKAPDGGERRPPDVLPEVYTERQVPGSSTCAVHAVNHVLQRCAYSVADFLSLQQSTARDLLEQAELHGHAAGDWSIEVIGRALRAQGYVYCGRVRLPFYTGEPQRLHHRHGHALHCHRLGGKCGPSVFAVKPASGDDELSFIQMERQAARFLQDWGRDHCAMIIPSDDEA